MSGAGTPPFRRPGFVSRVIERCRKSPPTPSTAGQASQSLSQPVLPATVHNSQWPGQQFLPRALERLDVEVRETIRELTSPGEDVTPVIARALAAANDQKKICEAKRWKWTIRGREILLQDTADKIIQWLDRFKGAGDIAVNADPMHAGLLWAGFRVILEAAVSERHEMAALLAGLETALYMSNRLEVYLTYFLRLPISKAAANFEDGLILFYATILDFLGRAIHTFQQSSATRALRSFWTIEDYDALEKRCKETGQAVDTESNICERELAAQDRQHVANQLKDSLRDLERLREVEDSLNTLHHKFDLSRLPVAKGAAFDSYDEGRNTQCLQGTRTKLLQNITDWANSPNGKPIYWINGMAGTGKSTVSRTVAHNLYKQNRLGASFFFKRDEADRRNARKLITTLAAQLAENVPGIRRDMFESLDKRPSLLQEAPIYQFEDLLLEPLRSLSRGKELFIVIDALDECDDKNDVRTIIYLLRQISQINAIRLFVTSRPDYPMISGFKRIKDVYQDMILHEVEESDIEHDINVYLTYQFQSLREERSDLPLVQPLAPDWPGPDNQRSLVRRAVPLFIFAATICRLVADSTDDPDSHLSRILQQQTGSTNLEQTYMPVFQQLVLGTGRDEISVARDYMDIIGPIITFADPLSVTSMSKLLRIKDLVISQRLLSLHSVLNVPKDTSTPVRIFHASFRDFLVDLDRRQSSPFWVDEQQTHDLLATRCLELLNGSDRLKENICNQEGLGVERRDVRDEEVSAALPAESAYACQHWVYHLEKASQSLHDEGPVHRFLKAHLLHWIEALCWLGRLSSVIFFLSSLRRLTDSRRGSKLAELLNDAKRFVLQNRSVIGIAPRQVYVSIHFTPRSSIVRQKYYNAVQLPLTCIPQVADTWSSELQKFECHGGCVRSVAFSPDGQLLASGSVDGTVEVWNPATGEQVHQLKRGSGGLIYAMTFSPDGELLTLADDNQTVEIWDLATGEQVKQFNKDEDGPARAVGFSPNGGLLTFVCQNRTVRLWDPATGEQVQQLEVGYDGPVRAYVFSPGGQLLALAIKGSKIGLWDVVTGRQVQQLRGYCGDFSYAAAFSPNGQSFALGYDDGTIHLWDLATGVEIGEHQGHEGGICAVAFSPDGQLLASASGDHTARLWDLASGEQVQQPTYDDSAVEAAAFSPDGQLLASASDNDTVNIWNPATGERVWQLRSFGISCYSMAFSPDGKLLALGYLSGMVKVWDITTDEQVQQLRGHSCSVDAVAFSPDGKLLALGYSGGMVKVWDITADEQVQQLRGHNYSLNAVAFSPDGKLLALGYWSGMVKVWNITTDEQLLQLRGHSRSVDSVAFSPDGQLLASASSDKTVRLWDPAKGSQKESHTVFSSTVVFSRDGKYLETDAGRIEIDFNNTQVSSTVQATEAQIVSQSGRWIRYKGSNIIWLPYEWRSICSTTSGTQLAIGSPSGRLTFLSVDMSCGSQLLQIRARPTKGLLESEYHS